MVMFSIISMDFFELEAAQAGYLMSFFGVLQMVSGHPPPGSGPHTCPTWILGHLRGPSGSASPPGPQCGLLESWPPSCVHLGSQLRSLVLLRGTLDASIHDSWGKGPAAEGLHPQKGPFLTALLHLCSPGLASGGWGAAGSRGPSGGTGQDQQDNDPDGDGQGAGETVWGDMPAYSRMGLVSDSHVLNPARSEPRDRVSGDPLAEAGVTPEHKTRKVPCAEPGMSPDPWCPQGLISVACTDLGPV